MIIQTFPVMPRSDARDPRLRTLLDALDGGELSATADDAAAALGAMPSAEVTAALRARLRDATEPVGPTELTEAILATLTPAETARERQATHDLYVALGGRRALVRRIAEALADHRADEAWRDLADVAARHPSAVVRASVAGAMIGIRREDGSDARTHAAPLALLEGLVDAVDNRDNDTWSIELRRYAAEAAMIRDARTAYDRLAQHLAHPAEDDGQREYTLRGIAAAWFVRMKPEDDPRFARALCELLDADASVPISVRGVLARGAVPEAVDGALAALARVTAGQGHASSYLFEALATCRDPRIGPALLRALDAPATAPLTASILYALQALDDPATLPGVEARMSDLPPGDKRLKLYRAAVKHLGRNAPKKAKAKPASAPTPEPLAPGLSVWFAPPPLSEPRSGDPSLDAALAGLPATAEALAKHRDAETTARVRARLAEAAEGLCDFSWNEDVVSVLAPALKGRVRKAYNALYSPVQARVELVGALAVDLARRWDTEGDRALLALLARHRYPELREALAPAVLAAEPSAAVVGAIAARIEDPTLGIHQPRQLAAAADALFVQGEPVALAVAERHLGAHAREPVRMALAHAAATHLTAQSDRRWLRLLADDARGSFMPISHFTALARLADPGSADAIGAALAPLMEHGVGLEYAVRAFVTLGDPRGAEHVLRILENPKFSIWFAEGADALRRLGGPALRDRVHALQARVREGTDTWRSPSALAPLLADWAARAP